MDYEELEIWRKWAREVCDDFRVEYDDHDEGLRSSLTECISNATKQARVFP